jgi:hypothetical protein
MLPMFLYSGDADKFSNIQNKMRETKRGRFSEVIFVKKKTHMI